MSDIKTMQVPIKQLQKACVEMLLEIGVPENEAKIIVSSLVEAEQRGVHSHGVTCLSRYISLMEAGIMKRKTEYKVLKKNASIEVWDGLRSNAQVLGYKAMHSAMEMAKENGIGMVAIARSNHFGAGAYYAELAQREGMIGLVTSTGSPTMAPWGGSERMIGNNPLSVAIPTLNETPIVLDMAQSIVAFGRITNLQKQGIKEIPKGWALDSDGVETTDSSKVYSVMPLASYKGFGLALIIDVLSGILFGGDTGARADDKVNGPSQLFAALNVEAFGDKNQFLRDIDARIHELKVSHIARNSNGIKMPGELEFINYSKSQESVECLPEVIDDLNTIADKLNTSRI